MIKESYTYKRNLIGHYILFMLLYLMMPTLFFLPLINIKIIFVLFLILCIGILIFRCKILKQINITPSQIEIINVCGKYKINVVDIQKVREKYIGNMQVLGKCIVIKLKDDKTRKIHNRYLDKKSSQLLKMINDSY
jgi:hypothetical protein